MSQKLNKLVVQSPGHVHCIYSRLSATRNRIERIKVASAIHLKPCSETSFYYRKWSSAGATGADHAHMACPV